MSKKMLIVIIALLTAYHLYSQSGDSTDKQEKSHLKVGIEYTSNQTYAGRTDSLRLPVITPSVDFVTHSGFYVKASGYLNLSKNNQGFDGIGIEPGYEFSKGSWNGSVAFIKNFISDSSNLIIAPVKSSIEFYLDNENKIITPSVGAEYLFSSEGNDFIIYAGLSKSLSLTHADKEPSVILEPSVSVSGGTQNFYYSFLKAYAGNSRIKSKRGTVPLTQTTKQKSKQFAPLDNEFEMPITISKGKFEWKTTPALESPFNLINEGSTGTQAAKSYVYVKTELVFTF